MLVRKIASSSTASDGVVRGQLLKLRMKAIRAGVWFRALRRIDRALIDLTIKVIADNVRSFKLAKSILSIERKLEGLFENKITRAVREIGLPLAQKLSQFAQNWGRRSAKNWATDLNFARFLAAMNLNEHNFIRL